MEIKIDSYFDKYFSSLDENELRVLEDSLKEVGCQQPLIIWKEKGILIDGHNRYRLCTKLGIPFKTKLISLKDRNDVEIYIIKNQLGRRNITASIRSSLVIKLRKIIEQKNIRESNNKDVNDPLVVKKVEDTLKGIEKDAKNIRTSIKGKRGKSDIYGVMANVAGVSRSTIIQASVVDKEASDEDKSDIEKGVKSVKQVYKRISLKKKTKNLQNISFESYTKVDCRAEVWELDYKSFLENKISDNSIDLLITDPPSESEYSMYNTEDSFMDFVSNWISRVIPKLKKSSRIFIFLDINLNTISLYKHILSLYPDFKYSNLLVWHFSNLVNKDRRDFKHSWRPILCYRGVDSGNLNNISNQPNLDVLAYDLPDNFKELRYHKDQKPISLIENLIAIASNPKDLVVDPFAGTSTVMLEASRLGRIGIGCDIDPSMLNIARSRHCKLMY